MTFSKKVFIVEDDKDLRGSFTHIVNNADKFIAIGSYASAEEAIHDIPRKKPDII